LPGRHREHDVCAGMWYGLGIQLGAQDSQCSVGSGFAIDAGSRDNTPPSPRRSSGCCDAGPSRPSIILAVVVIVLIRRRRS
jgi:hypothetical protein